jgi:zinc and cadmium transporter
MNSNDLTSSLLLILVSIIGALIPYFLREKQKFISIFIALSAGLILGITLFHIAPDIVHIFGYNSLIYMQFAIFIPLLLDYILKQIKNRSHADAHKIINPITVIGFSLHAFVDGVLIVNDHISDHIGELTLIGILIHKLPVAFSLFVLLQTHLKKKSVALLYFSLFTIMSPLGIITGRYILALTDLIFLNFLGAVTAGMFIYIGLIHLFIDHKIYQERRKLIIFLVGLSFAFLL